ncbi:MAG: proline--tRNA ligase [Candidatus Lokiarchaeota archaeon]|nr:proline--tRNA ligase [Candidatus Lokiarchaeota archaeon]MBD3341010.1 proline--tRNA ligase [Candidatus Lokiarchaeota archaeon]
MAKKKKDVPLTGITVSKEEDFSAWYTEILEKADLADIRYNVKGFVCYRPWATLSIKKMYVKYENLLEKNNHLPLVMPSVIPESNFELEADHVKGFAPEVFWVTQAGSEGEELNEKLALRPTSETALYKMYHYWIRSYRDLPFKRYQSCQVWRYEGKMTRPFFRGREFHWIEAHDCFATREDAKKQVIEDMEMTYEMLQDEFCIPIIFFERPQWDKFSGAEYTYAADALMGSGKVLQLPSTHLLGQNFSKPFDVKFVDTDSEEKYCFQTCYGPAISRIYGAMIAYLGDDNGLILPFDLAPVQVVIVPILIKNKEGIVLKKCKELIKRLEDRFLCKFDDSDDSPGSKFYYWEMKGVPFRIEIGPRDIQKDQVVIVRRYDGKKLFIKESDLEEKLNELANSYTEEIKTMKLLDFEQQVEICYEKDSAQEAIENGKIVCCGFCSIDMKGYRCAETVEKDIGGEIRGKRVDHEKHDFASCIICGEPATCTVYIAKSY